MSAIPKILVPLTLTDAMVSSSTVAEPSAAENAWVSAGTYLIGDRRIRTQTHREYECLVDHTGITTLPEDDPTRWQDIGPTDKWAMFDNACSTQTTDTTSLSIVLEPGFFNAIALYRLSGATLAVTVKDEPAGTTIFSYSGALDGPYTDEYDWCWGPFRENSKYLASDILPYPAAEITITVAASTGTEVGIGMVAVGDLRPLLLGDWGGAEYGARVEPIDYSYIKTNDYGETEIRKRRNATDLRIPIAMRIDDADYAIACVQEVLAVPVAIVAADVPGYGALNAFGLISASMSYDNHGTAKIDLTVKGLI